MEDEIRRLIAQLRDAFENNDDAAVEETIQLLEAATAKGKPEEPPAA